MFTIELNVDQAARVSLPIRNERDAQAQIEATRLEDGSLRVTSTSDSGPYFERFELNLWLVGEAKIGAGAAKVILGEGRLV